MGFFDKIKSLIGAKKEDASVIVHEEAAQPATQISKEYMGFSAVHTGANLTKKGMDCRDRVETTIEADLQILAIADGHFGKDHPRSDRGADFACKAVQAALRKFAATYSGTVLEDERKRYEAMLLMCRDLILQWHALVEVDAANLPFTEEELDAVSSAYKNEYAEGKQIEHAYRASVVALMCTGEYTISIGIGDGTAVIIDRNGKLHTAIEMLEKREAPAALSDHNAIMDFRFDYTTELPAAAFVANGSVVRCYPKTEVVYTLCSSICTEAAENGEEMAKTKMMELMPVLAEKGNRDDAAMAALMDRAALPMIQEKLMFFLAYHKNLRDVEEVRRRLARINRTIRERQKALEVAQTRASDSRTEMERLESWTITGIELSEEEMTALREGIDTFEERINLLTNELEALQREKEEASLQMADLLAQLAKDEARIAEENEVKQ